MKELVVSLSRIQKLKEELNRLNKEYLKLYEEMEDLNNDSNPFPTAEGESDKIRRSSYYHRLSEGSLTDEDEEEKI